MLDDIVLGAEQGGSRSHGSSVRQPTATAHSSTARMRMWTNRAVCPFLCQIAARISSTSALMTCETGTFPVHGKAWSSSVRNQFIAYAALHHPARLSSTTSRAAWAKVGMPTPSRAVTSAKVGFQASTAPVSGSDFVTMVRG